LGIDEKQVDLFKRIRKDNYCLHATDDNYEDIDAGIQTEF